MFYVKFIFLFIYNTIDRTIMNRYTVYSSILNSRTKRRYDDVKIRLEK